MAGLYEPALDNIAAVMGAMVTIGLRASRMNSMRSIRCDQARRLQSAVLRCWQP